MNRGAGDLRPGGLHPLGHHLLLPRLEEFTRRHHQGREGLRDLLLVQNGRVRLTEAGFLLSDSLFVELL